MPIDPVPGTPAVPAAPRLQGPTPEGAPIDPKWEVKPDSVTLSAADAIAKQRAMIQATIKDEGFDGSERAILGEPPVAEKKKLKLGVSQRLDDGSVFEVEASPRHRGTVSVKLSKKF